MTDKALDFIASNVGFNRFALVSAREFNACYSHGNPVETDNDLWFYSFAGLTATVCESDGQWWSEITNDREGETGIAQGWGDTPEAAWEMSRALINEKEG